MSDVMKPEDLEHLMNSPDKQLVDLLLNAWCDPDGVTDADADKLVEAGYIRDTLENQWLITDNGYQAIASIYPQGYIKRKPEKPKVEMREREAKYAGYHVKQGFLKVIDGRYRITETGKRYDGTQLVLALRNKSDWPCDTTGVSQFDGVIVGEEETAYRILVDLQKFWRRHRKRIGDSLTIDERRALGLPSPRPLSPDEERLKIILIKGSKP
jgi:hypothetical protein